MPEIDGHLFRKVWRLQAGRVYAAWADDLARVAMGVSIFHGVEESTFVNQIAE